MRKKNFEVSYRVIGVGTPGGMVTQLDALLQAVQGELVFVPAGQT